MKYHGYGGRNVRIQEVRRLLLMIFMSGFLAGIIYANVIARTYIMSMGILDDYFLEQYAGRNLNSNQFLWYIIQIRFLPLVFLLFPGNIKIRRIIGFVFVLWTGFSCGLVFTMAILKLGEKGILLCAGSVLPHFICYFVTYTTVLLGLYIYPEYKWNSSRVVSTVLFFLLGIVSECHINPVIMDGIIHLI